MNLPPLVPARLGVNIDHVATLRQLRGTSYPNLLDAAHAVDRAGGHQITVHLREDRRHIQDADVFALRKHSKLPLNLEMAMSEEMLRIAKKVAPDWVCLVPEKRKELTTEGGLNLARGKKSLASGIAQLKKAKIRVSLFIEPSCEVVQLSHELGADAVEFHTGKYCRAAQGEFGRKSKLVAAQQLKQLKASAELAHSLGLHAHAGHGFDYENLKPVADLQTLDQVSLIEEFNIGHAIVCRAVFVGLEQAVREMVSLIQAP
ncbi:MAG: pyridoxine 5'-phosphate synthase [Bdellovibrionia bacterium]